MGKQKPLNLSGKIGNLIFYERHGTPCVRTMPDKVRRTKATKASATLFGHAAWLGRLLREGLGPVLPVLAGKKGKVMMYRVNNMLLQWLRSGKPAKTAVTTELAYVNKFEFNPESELDARLKQKLSVNWTTPDDITLNIPALDPAKDIAAPAWTSTVHWKIMAIRTHIDERAALTAVKKTEMDMPYNEGVQAAKQLKLNIALKPGELTIVAVALKYTVEKKGRSQINKEERWLPAAIVGVCFGKME